MCNDVIGDFCVVFESVGWCWSCGGFGSVTGVGELLVVLEGMWVVLEDMWVVFDDMWVVLEGCVGGAGRVCGWC